MNYYRAKHLEPRIADLGRVGVDYVPAASMLEPRHLEFPSSGVLADPPLVLRRLLYGCICISQT